MKKPVKIGEEMSSEDVRAMVTEAGKDRKQTKLAFGKPKAKEVAFTDKGSKTVQGYSPGGYVRWLRGYSLLIGLGEIPFAFLLLRGVSCLGLGSGVSVGAGLSIPWHPTSRLQGFLTNPDPQVPRFRASYAGHARPHTPRI